jgi:anti-anti-sigma regulatory factor
MNDREPQIWAGSDPGVVVMPEQIDADNAAEVVRRLDLALLRGFPVVVADFTITTSCDGGGLKDLALAHRRAAEMNVELRAVIRSPVVLRAFTLAGLNELLPMYASLDAALAAPPVPEDSTEPIDVLPPKR